MECSGVILKKLREINQLSLKQAAQKIERSVGWLSEVENNKGYSRIMPHEFEKIIAIYGGDSYRKQFGGWIARSKISEQKPRSLNFDGPILKYLRSKAKLTLEQVAVKMKMSAGYLADIENGNRRVDLEFRNQLLGVYGYSPSSFKNFSSEDKRAGNIPLRDKLNVILRNLNDSDIERIFNFAMENLIQK